MKLIVNLFGLLSLQLAIVANANVEVQFIESAPKDRFVIMNSGKCALVDLVVDVDLTPTNGKLIFDTTGSGVGVEVFQPFEVREGDVRLISSASVSDGDKTLSVRIGSLAQSQQVSFTIDVDDTLPVSDLGQIRVSGAEIEKGTVRLTLPDRDALSASFDANGRAIIESAMCL